VAFPELAPGERAVLDLIAGGLSNTEIAGRLSLSPKTVRYRSSAILAKLRPRGSHRPCPGRGLRPVVLKAVGAALARTGKGS
jgi:hypothetical protein